MSVGYVPSGHLTLEKRDTGERRILEAGRAVAETVQTTHRGAAPARGPCDWTVARDECER
jgi:quercetin dioxygenase-like cupin family protein